MSKVEKFFKDQKIKDKIALFCNVDVESVITAMDVKTIYEVPISLESEGLSDIIISKLGITANKPDLNPWKQVVEILNNPKAGEVEIAVVGKYVDLQDSYKSLTEALVHGGISNDMGVNIHCIDSEILYGKDHQHSEIYILGFDYEGIEGKINNFENTQELIRFHFLVFVLGCIVLLLNLPGALLIYLKRIVLNLHQIH